VVISPIADPACAEPGSGTYNYEDQKIYGYYVDATTIKTLLPTDFTGIARCRLCCRVLHHECSYSRRGRAGTADGMCCLTRQ